MLVERVLAVARRRLVTIDVGARLTVAAGLLGDAQVNLVVVCAFDGTMVGVITKTDVVRQISLCQGSACMAVVEAVMTRNVTHCRVDAHLHDVWSIMKERGFLHIPIVDKDSRPCGVLNARDALQALLGEVEDDESLLRDYVMGIGYR
jgi:CBS domain-containing protein